MLGESIRKARNQGGMSLDALAQSIAELTGKELSSEAVRKWEVGKGSPDRTKWRAIEKALGQPEGWVFALLSAPVPVASSTQSITHTGTGQAAQHSGAGNIIADSGDGVTITGYDEYNPPAGVGQEEFAELLYWLKRHPAMAKKLLETARKVGGDLETILNG